MKESVMLIAFPSNELSRPNSLVEKVADSLRFKILQKIGQIRWEGDILDKNSEL